MDAETRSYRRYVLFILTLVYVFNFVDRQILVILQEPIKAELGLSDTQLGLLTGFAFALFYVVVGIPIARWADVGNRRNIVSLALVVWSGMTAVSGLAQNYVQLLLARIGVGIGEAGASPPSHSMLSDYYAPEERGAAMSIYSMGLYIGILVGLLLGGWLADKIGWRMAFFAVGLPGILMAVVVRLTLKEPPRGGADMVSDPSVGESFTFKETLSYLWKSKAFRTGSFAAGFCAFAGYSTLTFIPSFLIRSHAMSVSEVGVALGLIIGVSGMIGAISGGYLADKLGKSDIRWYMWVPGLGALISLPFSMLALTLESLNAVLVCIFISNVFMSCYLGPTIAIAHHLVKPSMRATTSAILFFILNIVGLGCGPVVTGMVSDYLAPEYGVESLRYALIFSSLVVLIAVVQYIRSGSALSKHADEGRQADA
ncbi:spinster family MFS transporter [Paraglaciecola arctica]|uniref:Major facilitator superfamily transporter n=1 Tax=Paraglaciecola arctica BSs20135 TaxID=493475 RepID=K6XLQ8_9ALTE|nr:MFS transporter [Paraglaciecola arctica]GAC21594.1 major facilitator superfamily transporter [Paraglaciecola arctica BSs20135]